MQTAIIDTRDMSTLVLCPSHFAEFTQRTPLVLGSQFTLHTERDCETCTCPPTIRNHGEGLVGDGELGVSEVELGASDGTTPAGRESAESNLLSGLDLSLEDVASDFGLDISSNEGRRTAQAIWDLFKSAFAFGCAGCWPDGEFASDAEWCNSHGAVLRALAEQLPDDFDSALLAYAEFHSLGLATRAIDQLTMRPVPEESHL